MDDNETTTGEGEVDASQLNAAAPETAVSSVSEAPNALTLSELNAALGKDFKDTATALKSFKDTFSFVGKRKEDFLKEAGIGNDSVMREVKELKENLFYKDNPDYAPYRAAISKMGSNPDEIVNTPEFKNIFEKAIGNDKDQKLRSVLVSNPRLASSKDNLTKAREATTTEERDRLVTRAVLDSLE